MNPTLIIAEIGVNHNADWDLALQMIVAAVDSDADVIKFQTAIPELVQTQLAPMAQYQIESTGMEETQLEMSRKFHFPLSIFPKLKSEVAARGKSFMSTAFDMKSLELLNRMGETRYKIPSGEITNLPYLRYIGGVAKTVLLSTGMATLAEVRDAVAALYDSGLRKEQLTILQCNTEYPTPAHDVNLNAMVNMGRELELSFGYSDHTQGFEIALAAVALGASVIEKHFTTDRNLPGPDQKSSLEPAEFKEMVRCIRNIEKALGNGVKAPSPSESRNRFVARRGIYAGKQLNVGDKLSLSNLVILRPEQGLSPMLIDQIVGKRVKKSIAFQSLINLDDVE
jgi:N-acetylneuraminate synthase